MCTNRNNMTLTAWNLYSKCLAEVTLSNCVLMIVRRMTVRLDLNILPSFSLPYHLAGSPYHCLSHYLGRLHPSWLDVFHLWQTVRRQSTHNRIDKALRRAHPSLQRLSQLYTLILTSRPNLDQVSNLHPQNHHRPDTLW
jgi:hypothetical protein